MKNRLLLLVLTLLFMQISALVSLVGSSSSDDSQQIRDETIEQGGSPVYFITSWKGIGKVINLAGGGSYDQLKAALEDHLLPIGIRGFWIGWSRLQADDVAMHNWLTLSNEYGLINFIQFTGWGYIGAWGREITADHPDAVSYDRYGNPQSGSSPVIDFHEYIVPYYQEKLSTIHSIYGEYKSIVGLMTNPKTDYPVYGGYGGKLPEKEGVTYSFNLETMRRFTEHQYYLAEVDEKGFHLTNRTKCKLWEHYKEGITYTIADLATDIDGYHDRRVDYDPPSGYIAYLNLKNAELMRQLHEYAESLWGRLFLHKSPFFHGINRDSNLTSKPLFTAAGVSNYKDYANVLIQYLADKYNSPAWNNMGDPTDNPFRLPTDDEKYNVYLQYMPLLADSPIINEFDWRGDTIQDLEFTSIMRRFGEVLNRMRYYGGWYGRERTDPVNILAIGALQVGVAPQFFTPAVNITHLPRSERWTWAVFPTDLTPYNGIVVWDGARPSLSNAPSEIHERIKTFVDNGGGLVVIKNSGWNPAFSEIFATSTPLTDPNHAIFSPYATVLLDVYEATYGSGKAMQLMIPHNQLQDIASNDSVVIPITNALLYVSGKNDLIPAWWHSDYRSIAEGFQPWSPLVYYSIIGKPDTPKLLWLSNRDNSSSPFEIHLNATFFNIDPKGWMAIDVQNWQVVAKGSGLDIKINATIPARSWKPIYIMNATTNFNDLYSNIFIEDKSVTTSEATYSLSGPYNQTSWLIINSTKYPGSVSSNITGVLRHYPLDILNASSTLQGWHYNSINKVLYIKFRPTSAVQITVEVNVPPTNQALTLVNPSIGTQGVLAAKQPYIFQVNVSDPNGVGNLNYVDLTFDPAEQVLRVRWDESTNSFSEVNDPNDYIELGSSSKSTLGNQVTLNFAVVFHWNYPDENIHPIRVYSIDDGDLSDTDDFTGTYYAENDVIVYSATVDDDHVNPNQTITFSGYIYYEGTTIPPPSGHAITIELGTLEKGTTTTDENGYYSKDVSAESGIAKHTYAVTAAHSISYKTIDLIVDRIKIVEGGVSDDRCDFGSTQLVWYKAVYEYDGKVFANNATGQVLKLNGTDMIWRNNRWEQTYAYDEVAKKVFHITGVNEVLYGLTVINNMAGDEEIIWDRLTVSISASEYEVVEGTMVNFTITITREYDSTNVTSFSIIIRRNGTSWLTLTDKEFYDNLLTVGHYVYTAGSVTDTTYGLSIFETNNVTVSWVKQKTIIPALQFIYVLVLLLATSLIVVGYYLIRRKFKPARAEPIPEFGFSMVVMTSIATAGYMLLRRRLK